MSKRILVGIATLNEFENIKEILEKLFSLGKDFDILVVDGASTDGTVKLIEELRTIHGNLYLIEQKEKMGLASAHMCIFKYALKESYVSLITLDADTSHDPYEIPKFVKCKDEFPESALIIGSRYMHGGKTDNKGFRLLISALANKVASFVIGGHIHEYTTSFRLYDLEKLGGIDSGTLDSKGYSFFFRIMYEIIKRGNLVKEVPIHFHERLKGKSKIPKTEVFKSFYELLLLRFKNREIGVLLKSNLSECQNCKSKLTIGLSSKSQNVRSSKKSNDLVRSVVFCTVCSSVNN